MNGFRKVLNQNLNRNIIVVNDMEVFSSFVYNGDEWL